MKSRLFAMLLWPLLTLGTTGLLQSCRTPSPTPAQTMKLYGLPPVLRISKGTVIKTTEGDVIIQEDTLLHSHGAYMDQVQRTLRP